MYNYQEKIENNTEKIPFSGCWIWMGKIDRQGYGRIYIREYKRDVSSHRLSYLSYKGDIPSGICVLHSCDTPSCCNPNHLFLGTKRDNFNDMMDKKRGHQIFVKQKFCKYGHELTEQNRVKSDNNICRICKNRKQKLYSEKLRSKKLLVNH